MTTNHVHFHPSKVLCGVGTTPKKQTSLEIPVLAPNMLCILYTFFRNRPDTQTQNERIGLQWKGWSILYFNSNIVVTPCSRLTKCQEGTAQCKGLVEHLATCAQLTTVYGFSYVLTCSFGLTLLIDPPSNQLKKVAPLHRCKGATQLCQVPETHDKGETLWTQQVLYTRWTTWSLCCKVGARITWSKDLRELITCFSGWLLLERICLNSA